MWKYLRHIKAIFIMLMFGGIITNTYGVANNQSKQTTKLSVIATYYSKPTVLFVCGGNTGRSVMAEWYFRAVPWYSTRFDVFSRGSGINPSDEVAIEPFAVEILTSTHEATSEEINLHRATPVSMVDIYKADIILTMTKSYKDRLINLIAAECTADSLEQHKRTDTSWQELCSPANYINLRNKIHTLIGCATGTDGDIPDAAGKDKEYYQKVRDSIIGNIDSIFNGDNVKCKGNPTLLP